VDAQMRRHLGEHRRFIDQHAAGAQNKRLDDQGRHGLRAARPDRALRASPARGSCAETAGG